MSVIEPTAARQQSKEAREAAEHIGDQFKVFGAAIVAEGEGFRAAAIRAALTAMYLFRPPKYSYKIMSQVADGARWLATKGAGPTEEEMVKAAATVRAKML